MRGAVRRERFKQTITVILVVQITMPALLRFENWAFQHDLIVILYADVLSTNLNKGAEPLLEAVVSCKEPKHTARKLLSPCESNKKCTA